MPCLLSGCIPGGGFSLVLRKINQVFSAEWMMFPLLYLIYLMNSLVPEESPEKLNPTGIELRVLFQEFEAPLLLLAFTLLLLQLMRANPDDFPPWAVEMVAFILLAVLVFFRAGKILYFFFYPLLMARILCKGKLRGMDWVLFFLLLVFMVDPVGDSWVTLFRKLNLSGIPFVAVQSLLWDIPALFAFLLRWEDWKDWFHPKRWLKIAVVTAWGLVILYTGGFVFHFSVDSEFRAIVYALWSRIQSEGFLSFLASIPTQISQRRNFFLWDFWYISFFGVILQEFYYRGYLFRVMEKRWSFWTAVFASSVLFVIRHGYWATQIFLFGLLACWVMKTSGSILPPIFLHIIGNTTTNILKYLARS